MDSTDEDLSGTCMFFLLIFIFYGMHVLPAKILSGICWSLYFIY